MEGHRDERTKNREPQIIGVGDGHGSARARGQEHVADHAARERSHDRENTETDGVKVAFARNLAAEDAIEKNAHEVNGSEDLGQGLVQRVEQVHGNPKRR